MNEGQIKIRILLIRLLDWLLYLIMVGIGVYAVMYSENPVLFGLVAIAGLLILSRLGDKLRGHIARLRFDLEKYRKMKNRTLR